MLNIAICDDDINDVNVINKICIKLMDAIDIIYKIVIFYDGQELLNYGESFDIIILDVQMKTDGISVGRELYKRGESYIIYISSYQRFCFQAINLVHAFAFIEKPVTENVVSSQLTAAIERWKSKEKEEELHFEVMLIEKGELKKAIKVFFPSDIYYFKFENRKIQMKVEHDTYFFTGRMSDIEEKMDKYGFARCHNAFVVNMRHISSISNL